MTTNRIASFVSVATVLACAMVVNAGTAHFTVTELDPGALPSYVNDLGTDYEYFEVRVSVFTEMVEVEDPNDPNATIMVPGPATSGLAIYNVQLINVGTVADPNDANIIYDNNSISWSEGNPDAGSGSPEEPLLGLGSGFLNSPGTPGGFSQTPVQAPLGQFQYTAANSQFAISGSTPLYGVGINDIDELGFDTFSNDVHIDANALLGVYTAPIGLLGQFSFAPNAALFTSSMISNQVLGPGDTVIQYDFEVDFTPFPAGPTETRILGDVNGDEIVDLADLNLVKNNFLNTGDATDHDANGLNPCPTLGDDNCDGTVDLTDLNNVKNNFLNTGTVPLGFAGVPEPATLALLAFGGLAMLRRRR